MGLFDKLTGGLLSPDLRGEGTGRYRGELRGLINQERDSDRMYGDATLESIRRGNQARVGGYDQALDKASTISRGARRDAITSAEGMQKTLTARMGAGGKFGTTALDNARMGLASSLTRDLESIDSGFADLFQGLAVGRGEAVGQGEDRLAQFQQGRGEQESELYRMLAGTLRQPKQGMLGGILGAAGAGLGAAYGGPAGGAFGGEVGSALGSSFERQ